MVDSTELIVATKYFHKFYFWQPHEQDEIFWSQIIFFLII
jgi:hypothetical protein